LCDISFGDDGALAIANAMKGNKSLFSPSLGSHNKSDLDANARREALLMSGNSRLDFIRSLGS
jgi:hypothetical protein